MTNMRKLRFQNYHALAEDYVGDIGTVFFDATTTTLRVGDGETPGGGLVNGVLASIQSDTTYTLQASDNNNFISFSSGSAVTLTVPAGLSAPFQCGIVQAGAGTVTVSAGMGVVIHHRQSLSSTAGQYAVCSLISVTTNEFIFAGDAA